MTRLLHHPQWKDTGTSIETVSGDPALVTKLEVDNTTTYIDKDGSNNMTFTDAVTGTKTLAELAAGAGGGASTALDNLASVAINTSLVSDTDNTDDLGSSSKTWKDLYLGGKAVLTPSAATTQDIINITPSAAIGNLAIWRGAAIEGAALDPSAADAEICGYDVDFSGVSETNAPIIIGVRVNAPEDSDAIHISEGQLHMDTLLPNTATAELTGIDMVIDSSLQAATSDYHAMDVATTGTPSGRLVAVGTHTGIIPIHQDIAAFTTPSQTEYAGVKHTGGTVWADGIDAYGVIFAAVNDAIYVGSTAQFSEIEVIMNVGATKSIAPTFWYNTAADTWTQFYPADDTDGFQQSGDIRFELSSISGSWTNDGDPGAGDTSAGYWIKIVRTRVGTVGSPDPTTVKTGVVTEYEWDKDGDVSVANLVIKDAGNIGSASDTDAIAIAADGSVTLTVQQIADNHVLTVDDADAADNDYAKFTANGLEGRSYAEVRGDINASVGAAAGKLKNLVIAPISGEIIRILNGADSDFSASINSAGSGGLTATNVPYDGDSFENMFNGLAAYDGSSYWGQIILHNTTRGNSRKIVSVDRTNNAITTTSSTDDWADNDVITTQSQTNTTNRYFDVDLSDNIPTTTDAIFLSVVFRDNEGNADANRVLYIHPYTTYDAGKRVFLPAINADDQNNGVVPVKIIDQKITMAMHLGCVDITLLTSVAGYTEYADT